MSFNMVMVIICAVILVACIITLIVRGIKSKRNK